MTWSTTVPKAAGTQISTRHRWLVSGWTSGSAGNVTVKATLDSDVNLSELECEDAAVKAELNNQVTVRSAGRLDAEASGPKVRYTGDPTLGEIKSEMGGSVERK
jgi:hypothetical protein